MRIPDGLEPLFDYGILEEVVRPLMSGKEAQVFLVVSGGRLCVAKVYKEAQHRTFKNRAEYTEGRKVRNSRDQRAMGKRTKHGRSEDEAAWRSTEVDMIRRLHAGGVRVPTPYHFVEGVLLMEMVADAEGDPAPRLGDLQFQPDEARFIYDRLIREVVRMLCLGIVHGDLSGYNVLVGADGPVIIDFPQSVDTASNSNARKLLLRDVENLHDFLRRFVPGARRLPYAEEMWDLYQQNALTPDTPLGGRFRGAQSRGPVNLSGVLGLIQDANYDERKRRDALGIRGGPPQAPPPRDDRPQPPRDDRPQPPRGDQPNRPQGDRPQPPRDDRPQPPRGDRPQPPRGDRPQPPRGDRPRGPGDSPREQRAPQENRPSVARDSGQDNDRPRPAQDERPSPAQGGDRPLPTREERASSTDNRNGHRDHTFRNDRPAPRDHRPNPSQDAHAATRDNRSTPRDDRPRREDRQGPPGNPPASPQGDRSGPPRDDRAPQNDRRGPPRDDRRGPPRDDRRGPPRDDRQGPPRDDRQGPPRDDRQGPPGDRSGPPRGDRFPPSRGDRPPQARGDRPQGDRGPQARPEREEPAREGAGEPRGESADRRPAPGPAADSRGPRQAPPEPSPRASDAGFAEDTSRENKHRRSKAEVIVLKRPR
jgi:RIO kinase 1